MGLLGENFGDILSNYVILGSLYSFCLAWQAKEFWPESTKISLTIGKKGCKWTIVLRLNRKSTKNGLENVQET